MSVNPDWRNQHTDLVVGTPKRCIDCKKPFVSGNKTRSRCGACVHAHSSKIKHDRATRYAESSKRKKADRDVAFVMNAVGLAADQADKVRAALTALRRHFNHKTARGEP